MILYIGYALFLSLVVTLEISGLSAFGEPWRYLLLNLIIGLFLLQRRSIVIGFIWIVLGSFLLEFSGLGSGHALAGIVAASAAAALDQLVFSRRSSWALLAEAAGAIAVYVLIRLLWLLVVQLVIGTELEFFVKLKIAALSWLMSLLAFMVFTWSWQQLVRWTGRVFVGRNKNYEVVFSNKK